MMEYEWMWVMAAQNFILHGTMYQMSTRCTNQILLCFVSVRREQNYSVDTLSSSDKVLKAYRTPFRTDFLLYFSTALTNIICKICCHVFTFTILLSMHRLACKHCSKKKKKKNLLMFMFSCSNFFVSFSCTECFVV